MKKKRTSLIKKIGLFFILIIAAAGIWQGKKVYDNVQRVTQYKKEVQSVAADYGLEEQTDLLLGIIYTESRGKGTDLMQSSESLYGEANLIDSQSESIKQGVKHFAEVYNEAKKENCDVWSAVQAYNFGMKYISYVKENGGKNSVKIAEKYSKEVLSPMLGNTDQSTYRYWNPVSLFHNGGYLYKNGGNMFYADLVKMNQQIIKTASK